MRLLTSLLLLSFALPLAAQAQRPGSEEIESLRVAIFTEKMGLTSAESTKFWPVYNEYRNQLGQLHQRRFKTMHRLRQDVDALDNKEVSELVDLIAGTPKKEGELTEQYHIRFKKILPVKKVAKLYIAEEAFKRELINRLRKSRRERR